MERMQILDHWHRTYLMGRMEQDDLVYRFTGNGLCCFDATIREPYAQMGSVEVYEFCCCCYGLDTDSYTISPGYGCDRDAIAEISEQLRLRKLYRGNIAQLRHQENLLVDIMKLSIKFDQILQLKKIYMSDEARIRRVFGDEFQSQFSHWPQL